MSENIIMPKLGMTMKEGTVEEWFKAEGDTVEQGESVCTISSEKLTQDVEAPASGTLLQIKVQAGEEAEVKSTLGVIGDEGESTEDSNTSHSENVESNNAQSDNENQQTNDTTSANEDDSKHDEDTRKSNNIEHKNGKRIFISPLARKMAKDKEFDITRIQGTGGNQRITKLDIQRVENQGYDFENKDEPTQSTVEASFNSVNVGEGLNPMRKRIAQNMRQSLNETAQLTLHRKVDADRLLDFKENYRQNLRMQIKIRN